MLRIRILPLRPAVLASLVFAGLSLGSVAAAACVDTNTCYGTDVLSANTSGALNSGFGYQALYSNTTGNANFAGATYALFSNTAGNGNTAGGHAALYRNTTGSNNTASGFDALFDNTTGYENTASGAWALFRNTTGHSNTAIGVEALYYNTAGFYNTASGHRSLTGNTTGDYNTASGYFALANNFTGNRNTADGALALINATSSRNVALGYGAGSAILTGGDNIIIGAGQKGKETDSGVIRIGSGTAQKRTFIAGIRGVTTDLANGVPVVIDANGQLGTISSSRRAKEDIQPMGNVSERLLDLQPVTFRYRQAYEDGSKPVQFGLIAEDVAEVFPELVVRDAGGNVETVSYHLLSALLVNELQKEHRINASQAERIASLEAQVAEIAVLKSAMARMAQTVDQLNRERVLAAN